jgi:hypothetical protein
MEEIILYLKIRTRLIMGFIKARLNKDNFWNLMFWLGMTVGTAISECLSSNRLLFGISICATLFLVPFIIKTAQDVKFDKKYGFFDNNGRSLGFAKDAPPKLLFFVIVLSIFLIIYLSSGILFFGSKTAYLSIVYFNVALSFIYKNCPISVMFSKHIIQPMSAEESRALAKTISEMRRPVSPLPCPNTISDIKYNFMSCNIHNYHYYRHR